jgi:hypothetical protein
VDQARDHLFAHARFAEDQDFGIRSCRFANLLSERHDGWTFAEEGNVVRS